ncbi:MAG: arylsulfatase [Opitutaceae bacterium]
MKLLSRILGLVAIAVIQSSAAERPNVLLILTDDQGYGDIGAHGNTMIRTPHLDRLHAGSVRFTDFHVDPTCSPTRAALLTGRHSTRTGVWHTVMGRSILFRDEVTLAEIFAANGYRTGIFGKWHLGDNFPSRPQDHGFQESVILGGGGIGQTPDFWGNDYFDDHYSVNGEWIAFNGYCTDVFFREAKSFIERSSDRPFFAYIPTNVPHSPFNVPKRYRSHYNDRGVPPSMASFYGMIENLDENVGRLLAWLKGTGRDRNTIVIFMTDNGTSAGWKENRATGAQEPEGAAAAWTGFNAGMRDNKGSQYEGGHRVPFFVRWPAGGIGGGSDMPQLAAHFDVLPTLVELCGLSFTPRNPLDGRSLVPLLEPVGTAEWPARTLFVHVQREEIPPKWMKSAAMTSRWRLVDGRELYDIHRDPGQAVDIAAQHPEVVARLRANYEAWWRSLEPSFSRFGYIVVGAPQENPSRLTCMDWHAPTVQLIPWNQEQINRMPKANGWWMIDVARAGRYAVTLRHKPEQVAFPLQAGRARVKVGDVEAAAPIVEGAQEVKLTLDLPAGPARLETWLIDTANEETRGAFFVEFEWLDQ